MRNRIFRRNQAHPSPTGVSDHQKIKFFGLSPVFDIILRAEGVHSIQDDKAGWPRRPGTGALSARRAAG